MAGEVDNAFAFVRPPGHHAESHRGADFCVLNNVALAARNAQRLGCERIAIVDWDVHHGNGAQEIFWNDADVLTISIHQDYYFLEENTGTVDHRREGLRQEYQCATASWGGLGLSRGLRADRDACAQVL